MLAIAAVAILGSGAYLLQADEGDREPSPVVPSEPTVSPEPSLSPSPPPSIGSPSPEGLRGNEELRMDGLGPITVGMSVEQVESATGERLHISSDFTPRCRYATLRDRTPPGIFIMVSFRKVVRIDVDPPSKIETLSGIKIGDRQKKVLRVYGDRVQIEPHPYLFDRGKYLVYQPEGEDELLLIFETDRGKITSFRSGYEDQVRYIEGCA